jgi:hypothetical protein
MELLQKVLFEVRPGFPFFWLLKPVGTTCIKAWPACKAGHGHILEKNVYVSGIEWWRSPHNMMTCPIHFWLFIVGRSV